MDIITILRAVENAIDLKLLTIYRSLCRQQLTASVADARALLNDLNVPTIRMVIGQDTAANLQSFAMDLIRTMQLGQVHKAHQELRDMYYKRQAPYLA